MALSGLDSPETDASTAAGLPDESIDDAIEEAGSEIDGFLRGRYVVPVPDATSVRYYARDIAAYLATLTFKRNEPMSVDDPVSLRYSDAIRHLVAIRDGKEFLDLPPQVSEQVGGNAYAAVINPYPGGMFGPADFFDGLTGPEVFPSDNRNGGWC